MSTPGDPLPADDPPCVPTCDGDAMPVAAARALARRLWLAGFAGLPASWAINAWLFRDATDPVVASTARASARAAVVAAALVVAWALAFSFGGPRLVGEAAFNRLNVGGWDLDSMGLRF